MKTLYRAAPTFALSALIVLAAAALMVGMPDLAHAAVSAKALGAHALHALPDLSMASIGLAGLRAQLTELETRAADKLAEVKDDLAPDTIRKIEDEHADLLRQVEAKRGQVAEAEKAERTPPVEGDARRAADLKADRQRASTIRDIGRRAGMTQADIDAATDGDTSVDAFRTRAFDHMAGRAEQVPTGQAARTRIVGATDEEKRGQGIENALLHRFDPAKNELTDHGRQYRGMTLLEMGCDMLEGHGVRVRGMSKHERAAAMLEHRVAQVGEFSVRSGGMHSTSDFPNVLANVANKTLRAGYQMAPRPSVRWCASSRCPTSSSCPASSSARRPSSRRSTSTASSSAARWATRPRSTPSRPTARSSRSPARS